MSRRPNRVRGAALAALLTWWKDSERGDVPGWVLITIMTAALVAALLVVAEPLLTSMFAEAVNSVRQ